MESSLSEEKVLKPKSVVSPEERADQRNKIQNLAEPLSEKEQELLSKRASGKTYKQIADEKEVNSTVIRNYIRQAVAKIQLNNNILPKEYELFADEFIKTFDLNLSKKEVINIIINNIELMGSNIDTLNSNINNTSKLLEVDRKDLIQAALKLPQLFCLKPENVARKVNIIKYYKQIQSRNNEQIPFSIKSDKNLYYNILAYLIKSNDGLLKALKQHEAAEYLKSQNKIYSFTITQNELADEFIKYAQEFSQSNFGKQIFNIVVK